MRVCFFVVYDRVIRVNGVRMNVVCVCVRFGLFERCGVFVCVEFVCVNCVRLCVYSFYLICE